MTATNSTNSGTTAGAAYTTIADVKTVLGISGTDEDAKLTIWLAQVESLIESYTRRKLTSGTYTEYYSGDNTPILRLRTYPVTSITSIYEDTGGYFGFTSDPFPAATLLTAGTDYALHISSSAGASYNGLVNRIGSVWPASNYSDGTLHSYEIKGRGNIKVTYVGGYAVIPKDLAGAAIDLIVIKRRTASLGAPVSSESLDYYSYTLASEAESQGMITNAKNVLTRYREMIW